MKNKLIVAAAVLSAVAILSSCSENKQEKPEETTAPDIPENGVTETFIHPSVENDELKSITGRWQDRVWEYQLMKDPYTHKYLKDHGVELISYRELIAMKGGRVR